MTKLLAISASRKAGVFLAALLGIVSSLRLGGQTCTPPGSGILGWWPGDVSAEDIAGTNHGILGGGATAATAGQVMGGFHFDGNEAGI